MAKLEEDSSSSSDNAGGSDNDSGSEDDDLAQRKQIRTKEPGPPGSTADEDDDGPRRRPVVASAARPPSSSSSSSEDETPKKSKHAPIIPDAADSDSSESDEVVRAPSRGPRLSDSEEEEYPDQKHRRHPPQRLPTAGGKNRRVGAASVERKPLKEWDNNPELFGVRRSGRERTQVLRSKIQDSSDSDDGRGRRRAARKKHRDSSEEFINDTNSDDDDTQSSQDSDKSDKSTAEDSDSDDAYKPSSKQKTKSKSKSSRRGRPKKSSKKSSKEKGRTGGRRRRNNSEDDFDDSDGEDARKSTRNFIAGKNTVSYKEDSEDLTDSEDLMDVDETEVPKFNAAKEGVETIERVLTTREGRKGESGAKVEDVQSAITDEDSKDEMETQYLIKWKGWAHIHNTWESYQSLSTAGVNGMKKLENYIKKLDEINDWKRAATPEDVEYYECNEEMSEDLYKQYTQLERIVASKSNGDYVCKWTGLSYSECTEEDGMLIQKRYPQEVREFEIRQKSSFIPSKLNKFLKQRPKFSKITEQPYFLARNMHLEKKKKRDDDDDSDASEKDDSSGDAKTPDDNPYKLRDYQLEGVNWMYHTWCKGNSSILADEMGLGKTIQTISLFSYIFHTHQVYGPYLVVVPLSTMAAWLKEFAQWAPDLNVICYLGDVASRTKIRECEWYRSTDKRLKFNVLVTTYEIVLKDAAYLKSLKWTYLAIDEAHRLKNDDSLLYKTLVDFDTNQRLLVTGTPLQNSLKELWCLLHFLTPDTFVTWEDFEEEHGSQANRDAGYASLHKILEPFLIRRVKKDVEKSLPSKVEQILRVEMGSLQKQYYKWILTKNYKALTKGLKGSSVSMCNVLMELKKCCNHAFLTRPVDEYPANRIEHLNQLIKGSGKLILLDKLLVRLKETGHRVLIFSQMVRMLDLLGDYLTLRHFPFQRLDGGIRGDLRKAALDHFNAEGSPDFCFLLSTRAGGLGINLATADTVIIFDSDWNPQNDLQAQARAHRIGQKNQVMIYRLVTKSSVEEDIIERAKKKMVLDHLVIQRMDTTGKSVVDKSSSGSGAAATFNKDELAAILKFGAEELFNQADEDADEEPKVDIDEILKRAETREGDQNGLSGATEELLSQFKVASFTAIEEEDTAMSINDVYGSDDDDDDDDENSRGTNNSAGSGGAAKDKKKGPSKGGALDKAWDDIIPAAMREQMDEDDRQQALMELHLPPRRKSTKKIPHQDSDDDESGKTSKKRGKKEEEEEESEESESDDSDDSEENLKLSRKKRPKKDGKEKGLKGWTDAEMRRFLKSWKKFAFDPINRLEAISLDAELTEKGIGELRKMAEMVQAGCEKAVGEHQEAEAGDETKPAGRPKGKQGARFKLSPGVEVNATQMLKSSQELAPIAGLLPKEVKQRKKWVIEFYVKANSNWDCSWDKEDDAKLLIGVYEHGVGSWEALKMDASLGLGDKILPDEESKKPQAKHIQTRLDYLLKVMKKEVDRLYEGTPASEAPEPKKQKATRGGRGKKAPITPDTIDDAINDGEFDDDNNDATLAATTGDGEEGEKTKKESKKRKKTAGEGKAEEGKRKRKRKKESESEDEENEKTNEKAKKKKKDAGPLHFTASSEPTAINADASAELSPEAFADCKDRMRGVKKSLKNLDAQDPNLSEKEQLDQTRRCLLTIGDHIQSCLAKMSNPEKIRDLRTSLWIFVSKFTEFDAKKLHKLYKHAVKRRGDAPGSTSSPDKPSPTKDNAKKESKAKDGSGKKSKEPKEHSKSKKKEHRDGEEHGKETKSKHHKSKHDQSKSKNESETADPHHGGSNTTNAKGNPNDWAAAQGPGHRKSWNKPGAEDSYNRRSQNFSDRGNNNNQPNSYNQNPRRGGGSGGGGGGYNRYSADRRDPRTSGVNAQSEERDPATDGWVNASVYQANTSGSNADDPSFASGMAPPFADPPPPSGPPPSGPPPGYGQTSSSDPRYSSYDRRGGGSWDNGAGGSDSRSDWYGKGRGRGGGGGGGAYHWDSGSRDYHNNGDRRDRNRNSYGGGGSGGQRQDYRDRVRRAPSSEDLARVGDSPSRWTNNSSRGDSPMKHSGGRGGHQQRDEGEYSPTN